MSDRNRKLYFLLCIIFLGFITRVPLTSISPLLGMIKGEYGISNSTAGILTTIPLAVFAACSSFIPSIAQRLRRGTTIVLGALIISCGILIRAYCGFSGLFIGTALIAVGIAIMNVLISAVIKWKFPEKGAAITGIYITAMNTTNSIALGIGGRLGAMIGWKNATSMWVFLGLAAAVFVLPVVKALNSSEPEKIHDTGEKTPGTASASMFRSPMAWWITAFFGMQSLLFFCTMSWLPTILASRGLSSDEVGYYAFVYIVISMPTCLVVPFIAGKLKEQKLLALLLGCFYLAGYVLLLTANTGAAVFLSVSLIGLCSGGLFSLVLSYRVLRGRDRSEVERLAAMSESVGYLFAAVGPVLLGAVADFTGDWQASITIMAVIVLFQTFAAWKGGRNRALV